MTEPERISEDDIKAMLAEDGDAVIQNVADDINFGALVEDAGTWLKNKMANDPESLPATFMIKLYLDGKKAISSKSVVETSDLGDVSILDRIDALPPAHAAAVLKGELARLDSLREDYFKALERIQEAT